MSSTVSVVSWVVVSTVVVRLSRVIRRCPRGTVARSGGGGACGAAGLGGGAGCSAPVTSKSLTCRLRRPGGTRMGDLQTDLESQHARQAVARRNDLDRHPRRASGRGPSARLQFQERVVERGG